MDRLAAQADARSNGAVRLIEISAAGQPGCYRCLGEVLHSPRRAPISRTAGSAL